MKPIDDLCAGCARDIRESAFDAAISAFAEAAVTLHAAWMEEGRHGYPFTLPFAEVTHGILDWAETVRRFRRDVERVCQALTMNSRPFGESKVDGSVGEFLRIAETDANMPYIEAVFDAASEGAE